MRSRFQNYFKIFLFLTFSLAACTSETATTPQDETPLPLVETVAVPDSDGRLDDEAARQAMFRLTLGIENLAEEAVSDILDADDTRFIPVFIELLRGAQIGIANGLDFQAIIAPLETLSGQTFGDNWAAWVEWYGTTDITPPPGFTGWKGQLLGNIDPGFAAFLQDDFESNIRVEEILWGGVRVDGIPALDQAAMIPASSADYLFEDEPVFGLSINGDTRAYPLRILDWHEMANDVVGGVPVSLAYCTLCGAGIAFDGRGSDGTTYDFGSSGFLYRSNKLMYDRQTRTLWNQLTGEPVLGPLVGTGVTLEILPVVVTTWGEWLALHPDTVVLDLNTGFQRTYIPGAAYGDYFAFYDTMFPVWQRSDLLETKSRVFALRLEGIPKAYPVETLVEERVVNDEIGGTPVVIVAGAEEITVNGISMRTGDVQYNAGGTARAYLRGDTVFEPGREEGTLSDQDGGTWQITEDALIGPNGETAPRAGGHLAYWFGWFSFFPNTLVYGAE